MPKLTASDTQESIDLNEQIANSGEGTVWKTSRSGYLAKVYKQPSKERTAKLKVMLSNRPSDPNSHKRHISFAWPQTLLTNKNGSTVGFLMPQIIGSRELIQIYNPKRRQQLGLEVDWRFLHTVATNIAHIIKAIHDKGYVIGDIKPQNILVNNKALVSIIDTDSFQVRDSSNGEIHHCLVGSPGFTPPELLGCDLPKTVQNSEHDFFRLAVIIHYILFGNPPFQGKWTRDGESPQQEELIKNGWWPYAPNSPIQAGPNTISLDIVEPKLREYFLRCFNAGHKQPKMRPSAEEWYQVLLESSEKLIDCQNASGHVYRRGLRNCYWCARKNSLGIDIFDLSQIRPLRPLPPPTKPIQLPNLVVDFSGNQQNSPKAEIVTKILKHGSNGLNLKTTYLSKNHLNSSFNSQNTRKLQSKKPWSSLFLVLSIVVIGMSFGYLGYQKFFGSQVSDTPQNNTIQASGSKQHSPKQNKKPIKKKAKKAKRKMKVPR